MRKVLATTIAVGLLAACFTGVGQRAAAADAAGPPPGFVGWYMPPGASAPVWSDGTAATLPPPPIARQVVSDGALALLGAPIETDGVVPAEQPLLSIDARPAMTGVLNYPLHVMYGETLAPAGAAVYGVKMGGKQYWCAPGRGGRGAQTICFRNGPVYWRTTSTEDVPFVSVLAVGLADTAIDEPGITLQDVDFHRPFHIGYFVEGWRPDRVDVVRLVMWDGKPYTLGCGFSLPRGADGAELVAAGQAYRLSPAADGRSTQITAEGSASGQPESASQNENCGGATNRLADLAFIAIFHRFPVWQSAGR